MVTEVNFTTLKDYIITILKANATLWNVGSNGAGGTFTKIERGLPNNNRFEGLSYPICFVTNDDKLETDKPFGPVTANVVGASEHTVNLKIIFFDLAGDGQATEDSLDAFHKTIKEVLKSDNNLGGNCTWSYPISSESFSLQYRGKALDGRIITVQMEIITN